MFLFIAFPKHFRIGFWSESCPQGCGCVNSRDLTHMGAALPSPDVTQIGGGCRASACSCGPSSQGFLTALWFELSSQITTHFSTDSLCGCIIPAGLWEQSLWNRKMTWDHCGSRAKTSNGQNSDRSFVFQTSRKLPQLLCIISGGLYSKATSEFL